MILIFSIGCFVGGVTVAISFLVCINKIKEDNYKLKSKLSLMEDLREIVKNDFVLLANETIKQEQEDLRKQNRESLEDKISPLTKQLTEFKEKIEQYNISGVENTTKIVEQIGNLEKNNKVIEQEAKNLVQALTKNQNVKGAYGENLLEQILKTVGMIEGVHYSKQFVTVSNNEKDDIIHTIRPDIVLYLPNSQHLVIDSKVTLKSFLEFIDDNSKIKEFKQEVKKRIIDLSNKNYQKAENLSQPDFVLMYIPIEDALNVIYDDSELLKLAYDSNVIIVGTSSLLTTLRLVNYLFSLNKQSENVSKIVESGTNLYDTFVQFCEDLIDLQKRFNDVNLKLGTTINRFKRGHNNKLSLFKQVEQLREFGICSRKNIPESLINESEYSLDEGVDNNG